MTVSSQNSRIEQLGDGTTTAFAVNFYFLENSDLKVFVNGVLQTITTNYTVTGAGNPAGGTVTFVSAPANGVEVVIFRDPAITQGLDYIDNDPFPAESHERGLDKLTMIAQRVKDLVSRALRLGDSVVGVSTELPALSGGQLLGTNPGGTGFQLYPLGSEPDTAGSIVYTPAGTGTVATTVENKLRERISVFDFMNEAQIADVQARTLLVDVTAPIQSAITRAIVVGAVVFFPAGSYRVTDTLSFLNANYAYSGGIEGENANSTRIHFFNATVLKNLFYVDSNINYLTVSDLEFIDNTARTSRAFYFFDTNATSLPAWKHLLRNIRITQFKEGARFDGGATIAEDTHCSEVMFLHSKCRNCETGLIYNNIQAVNHQLIGMDFENDTEGVSDEWTHIKMERGTTINHLGGSVIGKGPYLSYKYAIAAGFQDTSQFSSKGIRVEKRGGASPVISHDTDSTITLSNSIRIIITDMAISASPGVTLFARFGGRTFAKFSNVHANLQLDVEAYMTVNLGANGQYGSIVLDDCDAINYKRISTIAAYGSAGVAASDLRGIPCEISKKNEGAIGQNDGAGYFTLNNPNQTVYPGGWATSQPKTLVFSSPSNAGFGSGSNPATGLVNLPLFGRPCKFRLLRDDVNASSPFVLELFFVVAGVDYLVSSITPTVNVGGHFEADIQTATGLTNFLNDGVNWDGKMKVVKSGTGNGFVGLIMVDYM